MKNQDQTRPDIVSSRVYNEDKVKGQWSEVKGGVRKLWGQLTDDELEETKGDMTSITGLIQRKFGESKASIQEKLDGIFQEFQNQNKDEVDDMDHDQSLDEYDKDEIHRMESESPSESPIDAANRNTRERQL